MRIRLTPAVVSDRKVAPILDVAMLFVEEGIHVLDPDQPEDLLDSPWVTESSSRESGAALRTLIRTAMQTPATGSVDTSSVIVLDPSARPTGDVNLAKKEMYIPPLPSLRVLSTPLNVVVENEHGDGAFILAMANAFGARDIVEAYNAGRWRFHHAGGCDQILKRVQALSFGIGPVSGRINPHLGLRTVLMIDSDAQYPADETKNRKYAKVCQEHCADTHVLIKRSIENYLPFDLLAPRDMELFDIFRRMNSEQRSHFHMKRGFSTSDGRKIRKEELCREASSLYSDIKSKSWAKLQRGFGDHIGEDFLTSIDSLTEERLNNIGSEGKEEVRHIISMIRKHL
ncbi:MAG: hypothetical protein HQL38_03020 [Alphaproteobacteria bacterium]|nr:hypothetical protein [Alphaproteobacteria bacterium]